MTRYGFTITRWAPGVFRDTPTEGWMVSLPHQCDEWEISLGDGSSTYPPSYEKTVADLELFLAEAQQALADLKAKRPTESIDR